MSSDEETLKNEGSKPPVEHMPRKRATGRMTEEMKFELQKLNKFEETGSEIEKKLTKEDVERADYVLAQKRMGPQFLKAGLGVGTGVVAFTYMMGFYHLMNKNRQAWSGSWKSRVMLLGPMMSAFFAGNGVFPIPYQKEVDGFLGRSPITMLDIIKANQVKERQLCEETPWYSEP